MSIRPQQEDVIGGNHLARRAYSELRDLSAVIMAQKGTFAYFQSSRLKLIRALRVEIITVPPVSPHVL